MGNSRQNAFLELSKVLDDLLFEGSSREQKPKSAEWVGEEKQLISDTSDAAMRVAGDDAAIAQKIRNAKRRGVEFADMFVERTTQLTADYRKAFSDLSELEYEFRHLEDPTPIVLRNDLPRTLDDYHAVGERDEEDSEQAKPESIEAEFVFRPDGDGYFIKGLGESGNFSARGAKGLRDLFRLVQSPGVPVPMLEFDAGPGVRQAEGDGRSIQPVADGETFKQLATERRQLKADIEAAESNMERDELQEKLSKLESAAKAMTGLNGNPRDINNLLDKLRPKLLKRISAAVNKLREASLTKLADHFDWAVSSESGCMVYRPAVEGLTWIVTKL